MDRVYLTMDIPFLHSYLGNRFDKENYERLKEEFPQFIQRVSEGRGKRGDFHFKVPVEVWSEDDIEKSLDGREIASISISMRSPHMARGYFNMNRLYMKEHNINPYQDSYKDDNVLPVSIVEDENDSLLTEFCRLFVSRVEQFKLEYIYYLNKLFGVDILEVAESKGYDIDDISRFVNLSVQSAEVCVEWLHCESLQFQYITDERKHNYLKVYGDLTQTEYYTPNRKSAHIQWKRYQKGAGINRHEFTWNSDVSRMWLSVDVDYLLRSVKRGVEESYLLFGFDFDTLKPFPLTCEDVVQDYADWWKLPLDLVKTILFGRAYVLSFDFHTKGLRERLKSRKLIVPLERELGGKRGLWRWSDTVQRLRLSLQGYYRCPKCDSIMRYSNDCFKHVCEYCGYEIDYSRFSLGSEDSQNEYESKLLSFKVS